MDNAAAAAARSGLGSGQAAKQYLMGLEDKALMDEFVALYIGMTSNKKLEQQFRDNLNVSGIWF